MNRLRSGYVFCVLACFTACSAASTKSTSNGDVNGDEPGASDGGTIVDGGVSGTVTVQNPDGSTTTTVGGPGGAGVVPPPPANPCGASAGRLCQLDEKCQAKADCTSGICGSVGPSTGICISAVSCTGGDGADFKCGPNGNEDCCHTIPVPGGAYTNYNFDGTEPQGPGQETPSQASVSAFALDEFEVTVGRLRAFYTAKGGDLRTNHPAVGDGAHPLHAGSGWRASWNERLPGSWAEINDRMVAGCAEGGDNANWGATTWTPQPGANEQKPANCIDWYTLFAFCAWDGGRMPTDVEWTYVAMAGNKQLIYPYGNDVPTYATHKDIVVTSFLANQDATYGLYTEGPEYRAQADGPLHISKVGEKTGRSPWGHADMGGNVIEFLSEVAASLPATCNDCAIDLSYPDPPAGLTGQPPTWQAKEPDGGVFPGDDFADAKSTIDGKRLARGGSWMGEFEGHLLDNVKSRYWYPVWRTYQALGVRVARDVKP